MERKQKQTTDKKSQDERRNTNNKILDTEIGVQPESQKNKTAK